MPNASITFTDADGTHVLQNVLAPIGRCRFSSWEPRPVVAGQKRRLMANNARRVWAYRGTDRCAAFSLEHIAVADLELADRLAEHLDGGGTCAVDTGDGTHVYPTCGLAGDDVPYPKLADRKLLLYRMDFVLQDQSATPQRMLCDYGPSAGTP